jgi:hypothetical protein
MSAVQQPVQLDESHTHALPLQRWPCSQAVHGSPPPPQVCEVGLVTQTSPLQQPVGHDVGLQTH